MKSKFVKYLFFFLFPLLAMVSCKDHDDKGDDDNDEKKNKSKVDVKDFSKEIKDGFNFLIVGDWGRAGEYNQKEVAEQMNTYSEGSDAEFIISTGDNFYDNGIISIDDPIWNSSFENVYSGANLMKNWFVVLGNHDYHGNPQAEIDYTKKSRRWNMPSRYYTFVSKINDSVSARFVFIDTNPFVKGYHEEANEYSDLAKQDTLKQIKWIDSVLSNSKEQWKIVVGHHPVYSASGKHGNTVELIHTLQPLMEKYKVQIYFAGHDHDLQYLKPANSYVNYVISGAGSETRPASKNEMSQFADDKSGFAITSINSDSLKLYFVDYTGKVIYKTSRGR